MIIAIDGPAGSGKSTTAKLLAEKLDFIYLDTGAMYRAITFYFLQNSIDIENSGQVNKILSKINLSIHFKNQFEVHIEGEDVTDSIRSIEVNDFVSSVSKIVQVRKKMVKIQRLFSYNRNIVVEGRDIGSYVFPKEINEGYTAGLIEVEFNGIEDFPLKFTSGTWIYPDTYPFKENKPEPPLGTPLLSD